jgi:hypothetical protein
MGSGEADIYYLSKKFYDEIMNQKKAERKAPQPPKNPDRIAAKRRGRPSKDDSIS